MASPIDTLGFNTMDPGSALGAETEPAGGLLTNPPANTTTGQPTFVGSGDIAAGGGFNPVNNSQLESIFPTSNNPPFTVPVDPQGAGGQPEGGFFTGGGTIPVDPGGVGGQPEGGFFQGGGTIPVDPGPVGGLPEGGFFNQGPVGPPVTGTPPPEAGFGPQLRPLPPNFVNPGTPNVTGQPIPVDPNPVGGRPEGGILGEPLIGPQPASDVAIGGVPGPAGTVNPPPSNLISGAGNLAQTNLSDVNIGGVRPQNATPGFGINQLPPQLMQRLLAILAARQRAAG